MVSDFDPKKHQHAAYTFGIGRQYYEKVYCEASTFGDKSVPGPGNYNITKKFGYDSSKYSMVGRNKDPSNKYKVPGPGEYPFVSMNVKGRYPLSKMRNATGIVWSCSKAKRFIYDSKLTTYMIILFNTYINYYIENPNPGPGQYDLKPMMNGTGSLFQSKYRSCTAKTMAARTKSSFEGTNKSNYNYYILNIFLLAPGPGAYLAFSEFGIYESKNAREFDAKSKMGKTF